MAKSNIGKNGRDNRPNRIFRQMEQEIMDWFSEDERAETERYRETLRQRHREASRRRQETQREPK